MTRLTLSREIYCPIAEVFAYHTDLERSPQHWPNVIACTRTGEGFAWRYRMYGVEFTGNVVVREVEALRRFVFEASGGLHGLVSCTYTALTQQRTRVDVEVEYEVPLGLVGRTVDRLLVEHRNAVDGERAMDRLVERLEAEVGARLDRAG